MKIFIFLSAQFPGHVLLIQRDLLLCVLGLFILRQIGVATANIPVGFFSLAGSNQTTFFPVANSVLFDLNNKSWIAIANMKKMKTIISL